MDKERKRSVEQGIAQAVVEGHLVREEAEEVFRLAREMESLQDNDGFRELVDLVVEIQRTKMNNLVHGPTIDQAEYARDMGLLAGISLIRELPNAVREHAARREQMLERQHAREDRRPESVS